MMTEICGYLQNWFDRDMPSYTGDFTIVGGTIVFADGEMELVDGQYFRIIGSKLNDGVWLYGSTTDLLNETFTGTLRTMAVPRALVNICTEIMAWQEANGGTSSYAMSPFTSESFDGYSYSKASGDADASETAQWVSHFGGRIRQWKKL